MSIRADPKIDDPVERARIMREFERHLSTPTGYVLPVQRWHAQADSRLDQRNLADCAAAGLFLVPGDSPVGFRLPLSSLPHVKPIDEPHLVPADPYRRSAARCPIPQRWRARSPATACRTADRGERRAQRLARAEASPSGRKDTPVRTALAVEPRDGRLCVFMPPVERLEDYLELLAAVEATAARARAAAFTSKAICRHPIRG